MSASTEPTTPKSETPVTTKTTTASAPAPAGVDFTDVEKLRIQLDAIRFRRV
jgi:hypothetical protein